MYKITLGIIGIIVFFEIWGFIYGEDSQNDYQVKNNNVRKN